MLIFVRKMYFPPGRDVLVIICALVSLSCAQDANVKNAPCDISTNDDNNLTLNCSRRGLNYIPEWPEQIGEINKDTHVLVTFFNNTISNVTQLPTLPGGRLAISFKANKIVEIQKDAFGDIDQLVYLDLSKNLISDEIKQCTNGGLNALIKAFSTSPPMHWSIAMGQTESEVLRTEIFRGPYRDTKYSDIALETLNLGHNEIHSLDRYLFQFTPNLSRLYLNNNPIEILDHVTVLALASAKNLEVLDLSKTDIATIPINAFEGLTKLQQIDLSSNQFISVPESLSLVGNSLKYLTFNNNPIVELNDDSFIGLTKLVELEVAENDYLDEVKRSTFSPLTSLRVLHLCHNRNLRYISHNAFRGMKDKWTLKEVYLDDNDLSELSTDLMPWDKLDTLGMTGNSWLCNCDLANIVTAQGASTKFKFGEIPVCAAPMRLSGEYITNITVSFCPTFDTTFTSKKRFRIGDLKPKHVLWSIFGVATVVAFGMMLGWIVKAMKTVYKKKIKTHPIRYINLNEDSSFA